VLFLSMAKKENNTDKNIKAMGVTIAVHALVLVVLVLVGFSAPPPLPNQDLGMEVNLGTSDDGMGDEQPLNPNPPSDGAASASAPQNEPVPSQDASTQQDIATQNDEEAPEITKPVEKPVEKPKEQPKNLEPKPEKTVTKKVSDNPPAPVPPAPKPKAVFTGASANKGASGNNANETNNSTGEGNTGKPGDRGQINGDPNASGYSGGGLGGGRSDFRLSGRSLLSKPSLTYDGNESGYVAINIKVGRDGSVIDAQQSLKGSTINNPRLIEIARKAALQLKYNNSADAPEVQFALIRFYFKVQ
jgi:outer membrane biosynthesis protein TonB